MNFVLPLLHRCNGGLGERFSVGEPLVRQHRFNDDAGTVAKGLHDLFVFDRDHQPVSVDISNDLLACLEPVQPAILIRHEIDSVYIARVRRVPPASTSAFAFAASSAYGAPSSRSSPFHPISRYIGMSLRFAT